MITPIWLMMGALALGQAPARGEWQLAPRLASGMELKYAGTVLDEALSPNVHYQRSYRLRATLFVMGAEQRRTDVAFLTALSVREQTKEARADASKAPVSVRLELGSLDGQGQLLGPGLASPVSGPATIECGMVVEAPVTKVRPDQLWDVSDPGRPPRTWRVVGPERCGNVTCVKLVGTQQSDDWDRPRADHAAWRRRDTVWLRPQLWIAQRVERVSERRDPAHRAPTQRTTVRYELDSNLTYPGRLFEDRRREIVMAKKTQDDARPLLAQPAQYRPTIEASLRKIDLYLDTQAPTPYRDAILGVRRNLESARRGETPPVIATEETPTPVAAALGRRVPDFMVTNLTGADTLRLTRLLGRPVFVFFYNPATNVGKEVVRFAVALHQKHGDKLSIMAMAVGTDPEIARKQHADMKLPFAVLDGNGLHQTFGVDATPRLILLDRDGVMRYASTGWGIQTPSEINEELMRALAK